MWDKCETEYITYEWDSLCELGKKEEEESLLIGNQARLNIFQWETANELKYLQTEKTGILLFFRLSAPHIMKCPLTPSTLFWADFWKCLVRK